MIINWNSKDIKQEIDKIAWAECDPRMDGFITWEYKKELYELLWYVENTLAKCSTYANEEEFLKEHKLGKMWDILKDD